MNRRILKALIIKESLQIARDPSSILIAFVLPLILLFIYGYGINLDTNRINVGLVIEESNPTVSNLSDVMTHSPFLNVTFAHDRRSLETALLAGHLRGMIDIPQHFTTTFIAENRSAPIQIISDGSEPSIAPFVQNYTNGIIQVWLSEQSFAQGEKQENHLIRLEPRYWYNPELKSRHFLIPGAIAIIMTIIGTLLTALVVAREWERGTMESLMATPISIVEILLGKLIPYFILGMGSMSLCTLIAIYFYDVPFRGTLTALSIASALYLLAALAQGLLISTLAKNQFIASQMALMSAFLPAFMLSGFIFEISSMPAPIRALTSVFAARYFVTSLQTLFLTGNVWPLLSQCFLFMGLIGLVFFMLIAHKTRKGLD